jgi:hypothetical protein
MLDALSNFQRRKLLVALLEHNPQDDTPIVVSDDESERESLKMVVEMEHMHLPKLAEYDFIEWDRENGEVKKGAKFDEIRPLLELLSRHEDELPEGWL